MSASGKEALMGWYAQWYSEPVSHCGRLSAKGVAVLCMTDVFSSRQLVHNRARKEAYQESRQTLSLSYSLFKCSKRTVLQILVICLNTLFLADPQLVKLST